MVEQDIDGIDVNMGSPKSFSLKGIKCEILKLISTFNIEGNFYLVIS